MSIELLQPLANGSYVFFSQIRSISPRRSIDTWLVLVDTSDNHYQCYFDTEDEARAYAAELAAAANALRGTEQPQ